MTAIDLDRLRGWIGREETASEVVTAALVQRFCATFDRAADTTPAAAAPRMLHLCLAPPAAPTAELGHDGHPALGGFLPPVPLPRRMWAGGAVTFSGELKIGGTMTRRSVIRDVTMKEGRTGPLCFVTVEHRIACDGTPVLTERQDLVYRAPGAPGGAVLPVPPPAPDGAHRRKVVPSAPFLFRYSALTFNGHRIHYDAPFATGSEGYPGLIVHGPLQATLLVHFAESLRGAPLAAFRFRSHSALYDTAEFSLNATEAPDGTMALWTCRPGGPVAMEATAAW